MNEPGRPGGDPAPSAAPAPVGESAREGGFRPTREGGFLLLDKAKGVSSFQALHPLKRLFRGLKVGHAGTLDPSATGLLLVGVGGGTRLLEYLEGMPKTYTFAARFGFSSDTYDMEGTVDAAGLTAALSLQVHEVEKALIPFRGRIRQVPPAYSAVKVQGERAYQLARAGGTVTLEARDVEVHALELLSLEDGVGRLRLTCSKGTYVRSLAHDLGLALGCGAGADDIRRTAIGPFRVESAIAAATLAAAIESASPNLPLLPLESAVAHLPAAVLPAHRLAALRDGRSTAPGSYSLQSAEGEAMDAAGLTAAVSTSSALVPPPLRPPAEVRVLDSEGRFLAIATLSPEGHLCPKKVLARN